MGQHHTVSASSLLAGLVLGTSGTEISATLFGSEISNPLWQIRWFLFQHGHASSRLYSVVSMSFFLTFSFWRLFVGLQLMVFVLSQGRSPMLIQAGGCLMILVNLR